MGRLFVDVLNSDRCGATARKQHDERKDGRPVADRPEELFEADSG
jgi:hypothetical protein